MKNEKGTILLIEDDFDLHDLMEGFFVPKGYEVILRTDASRALEELRSKSISADVVITDLMLPGLTGIEFTKKMRDVQIEIPIILVTAHKKIEKAVEAIKAGAYDFVVKPLNLTQLLVSVERAIDLQKVKSENITLKKVVKLQTGIAKVDGIISESAGFKSALELALKVSNSNANVLITGESGTGKEVIANAIHSFGSRSQQPFVTVNCSAIPENLLESELFGHAKGSFTGAIDKKIGLFEEANGGTIFLDEIGDLHILLQAKLLRVIQDKMIRRVGETQSRAVDVRVIAATHRDLRQEIVNLKFREDLFFRLNVISIHLPPLRERKEDIVPLAEFFLKKFAALSNIKIRGFSKAAIESLCEHPWQGNVRELENLIERAVVLCDSDTIDSIDFGQNMVPEFKAHGLGLESLVETKKVLTIDELTKKYVERVLEANNGAKEKTAKDLGIDRKTLYRKLHEIQSQVLGSESSAATQL